MVRAALTIWRDSGLGLEQAGLTLAGFQVDAGLSEGAEGGWLSEALQGLAVAHELDGVMVLSIGLACSCRHMCRNPPCTQLGGMRASAEGHPNSQKAG